MNCIFRIDDRLIHGQVIVGWVKRLQLSCILVANDEVAGDPFQKNLMALAVPTEVCAYIYTLEEAARQTSFDPEKNPQCILLVKSLADAMNLVNRGIKPNEINLGGLHFKEHKKQYSTSVFLDQADIRIIDQLLNLGIRLSAQPLPDDPKIDIEKILGRDTR
jgi:mannose/fructose/N-acetylgalactosamine-specific phosphotransferase system component IIB